MDFAKTLGPPQPAILDYVTKNFFWDLPSFEYIQFFLEGMIKISFHPGWIKVEKKHFLDSECPNVGNFWGGQPQAASLADCKDACLKRHGCTAVSYRRSGHMCTLRACSFPIPMPSQSGDHDSYYQENQGKY